MKIDMRTRAEKHEELMNTITKKNELSEAFIDQAVTIVELRAKVAELDGQLGSRNLNMERTTENAQLQLENQKLREALENIAFEADLRWIDRAVQEALGETK